MSGSRENHNLLLSEAQLSSLSEENLISNSPLTPKLAQDFNRNVTDPKTLHYTPELPKNEVKHSDVYRKQPIIVHTNKIVLKKKPAEEKTDLNTSLEDADLAKENLPEFTPATILLEGVKPELFSSFKPASTFSPHMKPNLLPGFRTASSMSPHLKPDLLPSFRPASKIRPPIGRKKPVLNLKEDLDRVIEKENELENNENELDELNASFGDIVGSASEHRFFKESPTFERLKVRNFDTGPNLSPGFTSNSVEVARIENELKKLVPTDTRAFVGKLMEKAEKTKDKILLKFEQKKNEAPQDTDTNVTIIEMDESFEDSLSSVEIADEKAENGNTENHEVEYFFGGNVPKVELPDQGVKSPPFKKIIEDSQLVTEQPEKVQKESMPPALEQDGSLLADLSDSIGNFFRESKDEKNVSGISEQREVVVSPSVAKECGNVSTLTFGNPSEIEDEPHVREARHSINLPIRMDSPQLKKKIDVPLTASKIDEMRSQPKKKKPKLTLKLRLPRQVIKQVAEAKLEAANPSREFAISLEMNSSKEKKSPKRPRKRKRTGAISARKRMKFGYLEKGIGPESQSRLERKEALKRQREEELCRKREQVRKVKESKQIARNKLQNSKFKHKFGVKIKRNQSKPKRELQRRKPLYQPPQRAVQKRAHSKKSKSPKLSKKMRDLAEEKETRRKRKEKQKKEKARLEQQRQKRVQEMRNARKLRTQKRLDGKLKKDGARTRKAKASEASNSSFAASDHELSRIIQDSIDKHQEIVNQLG